MCSGAEGFFLQNTPIPGSSRRSLHVKGDKLDEKPKSARTIRRRKVRQGTNTAHPYKALSGKAEALTPRLFTQLDFSLVLQRMRGAQRVTGKAVIL